jgi:hypothetical protein
VALTYNLVHTGTTAPPVLEDLTEQHKTLTSTLKGWTRNDGLPERVVYLLEHEYTEANLGLNQLKRLDRKRVDALLGAADEVGFALFLCTVEKSISGGVDEDDYGYESNHVIVDVLDESLKLTRVMKLDGAVVARDIDIQTCEFVQEDAWKDRAVDEEHFTGFTGNAGAEATHWYRDAGVLIIRKEKVMEFLLECSHDLSRVLKRHLTLYNDNSTDHSQRNYVAQIIQAGIKKRQRGMNKRNYYRTRVPLDQLLSAALAINRRDLFYEALDKHTPNPLDPMHDFVLEQIGRLPFDELWPR